MVPYCAITWKAANKVAACDSPIAMYVHVLDGQMCGEVTSLYILKMLKEKICGRPFCEAA
jgi:hypothetical protein